jgi:hypothetical protein
LCRKPFVFYETNQETTFTAKDLRCLPPPVYLAEEMGESVGRGKVLLGAVPAGRETLRMNLVIL